ncbi:hypothetical protein ACX0G7_06960 [Flavitalea antarctica]
MQVFADSDLNDIFRIEEPIPIADVPYWTCEYYGFGKWLRKYGFYPKKLPIRIYTDHSGPSILTTFNHFELSNSAEAIMFHSPEVLNQWKQEHSKPAYNLYSPFVFYRRKNKVTLSTEALGTLAYPAHTIPELSDLSNIHDYIQQLKNLPDQYQPVSISLHFHDLNKGLHQEFIKQGFKVYTAGNPADYKFTERYYSILRNFRYTTSNILGSYSFYSIEMGIPFFLVGNEPIYEINENSILALEALKSVQNFDPIVKRMTLLFRNTTNAISDQQKREVETTLGLYHGIGRLHMSFLLYKCWLRFEIKNFKIREKLKLLVRRVRGI